MKDIWFGWITLDIGDDGMPIDIETEWQASCFVLFTYVIYIGKINSK